MRLRARSAGPPSADWQRLADGTPWRLRHGKHFDGDIQKLTAQVRTAAVEMGRAVRVAKDKFEPDRALWVQFADGAIQPGAPCICGARTLRSRHEHFVDCESCGRLLIVDEEQARALARRGGQKPLDYAPESVPVAASSAPPVRRSRNQKVMPTESLASFAELRLAAYDTLEIGRRYVAAGVDEDDRAVLLVMWEPHQDGSPLPDPFSPTGHEAKLLAVIPADVVISLLDGEPEQEQEQELISE